MALGAVLLAGAGLAVHPRVTLRPDRVPVPATPGQILAVLRARLSEGPDVLAAGTGRVVRRFAGRAGAFPYRTVELVSFGPDRVEFEHLAGPFATCNERFALQADGDTTIIEHTGTFELRGGLWAWALFGAPVRSAFEGHVRRHLQQLATELAPAE